MQRPQIVYKDIVINNTNADDIFRDGHVSRGEFDTGANTITIYNYSILPMGMSLSQQKRLGDIVQHFHDTRENVISHELHHWHNHLRFDICNTDSCENYFAAMALLLEDEITANVAEAFCNSPADLESIADAMLSVTERFERLNFDVYTRQFLWTILGLLRKNLDRSGRHLVQIKNYHTAYLTQPSSLYSSKFYNMRNYFYTFDGINIMRDVAKLSADGQLLFAAAQKQLMRMHVAAAGKVDELLSNLL